MSLDWQVLQIHRVLRVEDTMNSTGRKQERVTEQRQGANCLEQKMELKMEKKRGIQDC